MTIHIKDLEIAVGEKDPDEQVLGAALSKLGLRREDIVRLAIRKKSLDARRKARIVYHYQVDLDLAEEDRFHGPLAAGCERVERPLPINPIEGLDLTGKNLPLPPVIVGSGPAGIFAALCLAEAGQPCVVIERGEAAPQRLRTVNQLRRSGSFQAESNYCFGEGGAGTFSDGKLTCGRNHPLIRYLFEQWVRFGAPESILFDAHPHIGTDYLLQIALNMRAYLQSRGVQFLFNTALLDFRHDLASSRYSLNLSDGSTLDTDHFVLAMGHSARDTYRMLHRNGLAMAPKPFAIGARFEHPQEDIDRIQFGTCKLLPAAEYKLVAHAQNRGIWTFCMCPGGHLLPTSAQAEHLAINGMSYHARRSGFANAAVVVNVLREDFFRGDVLDGIGFQENLERLAFQAGGGSYHSPAQRMQDFLAGRLSKGELHSTYKPGIVSARLDQLLPDFTVGALRCAVLEYDKKMRGYLGPNAMVVGVETKTSAPVVLTRDKALQSVSHPGLFPCGEGAGFAGGIVSAALDGVRVGQALLEDALRTEQVQTLH